MSCVPFGYGIDVWPQMVRPKIVKMKKPEPAGFGSTRVLKWQCYFNDVTPTLFSCFEDAVEYVVNYPS